MLHEAAALDDRVHIAQHIIMMMLGPAMFAAWLGEAERRRRKGWSS